MKYKLFWVGIFLVIGSYVSNYLYFSSKQLDQPIFLDHFYTYYFSENEDINFQLYYLTNKNNPVTLSYIEIDDEIAFVNKEGQGFLNWMEGTTSVNFVQEYNHYYLMRETIQLFETNVLNQEEGERRSLNHLKMILSNGEQMTVDIGEITFIKRSLENQQIPLQFSMGSGSSNGISQQTATAVEPFTITDIVFNSPESMQEFVDIKLYMATSEGKYNPSKANPNLSILDSPEVEWDKVEGIDMMNDFDAIHVDKNQWLQIITRIRNENKSYLDFTYEIIGTTEDGDTFEIIMHANDSPYLEPKEINEIIKQKVSDAN